MLIKKSEVKVSVHDAFHRNLQRRTAKHE